MFLIEEEEKEETKEESKSNEQLMENILTMASENILIADEASPFL